MTASLARVLCTIVKRRRIVLNRGRLAETAMLAPPALAIADRFPNSQVSLLKVHQRQSAFRRYQHIGRSIESTNMGTPASRSAAGRVRSRSNFKYWPALESGAKKTPSVG
jgi:hypothetical protein